MKDDRWLSFDEIAVFLRVSKETVYKWLDRGSIPSHHVGKLWNFKPSEVDSWVKSDAAANRSQDSMDWATHE